MIRAFFLFLAGLSLWVSIGCCTAVQWPFPPVTISTPGVDASDPVVAIDPNGHVVAAWIENGYLISSSAVVKGTWSSPVSVSGPGVSSPEIIMDSSGNATAIWVESGVIKSALKLLNQSWQGTPDVLSSSGADSPQIGVDSSGDLVAVWNQSGVIMSSTKLFGGSWNVTPDTLSGSGASGPQIAVIPNGGVAVVWQEPVSSVPTIYEIEKVIGGSWGSSSAISTSGVNSVYPQLAMDDEGDVFVGWFTYQYASNQYTDVFVQVASKPYGGSWGTPANISKASIMNPAHLSLSISYSGGDKPLALWTASYDNAYFYLEWAIYTDGAWTSLPTIQYRNLGIYALDTTIDFTGNAYVTWMRYDPTGSNLIIEGAMSALQSFQNAFWTRWILSNGGNNGYPQVTANGNNTKMYGALVWLSNDGTTTSVQTLTSGLKLLQPPTGLSVVQQTNNYGVTSEVCNILSWTASTSTSIWGYVIERNNINIALVNDTTLEYEDCNQGWNSSVTYQISALDINGFQSPWASVTYP